MPKIRKSHPPSLKAKVAVEAIKAHKTAAQIAQMFGVHPTQVGGWKKQALAGLPDIFGNGREQVRQQSDAEKDELYKRIGQLKVELDFLQKRAGPHRLTTNGNGSIPLTRASASNSSANCWECDSDCHLPRARQVHGRRIRGEAGPAYSCAAGRSRNGCWRSFASSLDLFPGSRRSRGGLSVGSFYPRWKRIHEPH